MFEILFTIVLLLLLALGLFTFYMFKNPEYRDNSSDSKSNHGNNRSLHDMAKAIENNKSPEMAQLIINQLNTYKAKRSEIPHVLVLKMKAYMQLKQYNNALHAAMKLVRQDDKENFITDINLIEYLGEIYAALGQKEESYKEYLILLQKRPGHVPYLYNAGCQALEMKQYETASSLLEKAIQQDPRHSPSLCKLGRICYDKKLFSQALSYFNKASLSRYDSDELRFFLALTLLEVGGNDRAAHSLLKRVSENQEWSKQALPHLAKLSAKLEQYGMTVACITKYCDIFGQETSESLLTELRMLQADSYVCMLDIKQACHIWTTIPSKSSTYEQAQEYLHFFENFLPEDSIPYQYLHANAQQFVKLCAHLTRAFLDKEIGNNKSQYTLKGRPLKIISNKTKENYDSMTSSLEDLMGTIVVQHFAQNTDARNGILSQQCPHYHIFLRLNQNFTEEDLLNNLEEIKSHKEYQISVYIHIYTCHNIPQALFAYIPSFYKITIHPPYEFLDKIKQIQQQSTIV